MKRTTGSINIPTEIKKKGINNEFPTNWILFIKRPFSGISGLRVSPARKAPIIGSNPITCEK